MYSVLFPSSVLSHCYLVLVFGDFLELIFCLFFFFNRQFSSVAQLCPTLCDPMNRSTPGLPIHHKLPEFTQTHSRRVGDAIQSSIIYLRLYSDFSKLVCSEGCSHFLRLKVR